MFSRSRSSETTAPFFLKPTWKIRVPWHFLAPSYYDDIMSEHSHTVLERIAFWGALHPLAHSSPCVHTKSFVVSFSGNEFPFHGRNPST